MKKLSNLNGVKRITHEEQKNLIGGKWPLDCFYPFTWCRTIYGNWDCVMEQYCDF